MLNVAEKLKSAVIGKSLYSPLFGPLKYNGMEQNNENVIIDTIARGNKHMWFNQYGQYFPAAYTDSECMLFPDDRKTWEDWPNPKPTPKYKVGEWIYHDVLGAYLVTDVNEGAAVNAGYYGCENLDGERVTFTFNHAHHKDFRRWTHQDIKTGDILCTYENGEPKLVFINKCIRKNGDNMFMYYCYYNIKYPGFSTDTNPRCLAPRLCDVKPATIEQRSWLFRAMHEAGYKWNAEEKKLVATNHYDVENFEPFDPVLVRNHNGELWVISHFSDYFKDYCRPFVCENRELWSQCIPYNDDTKHLRGTHKMCDNCYINW